MLQFHKNKKQEFTCKITVEGADYSRVRSRLILSPTGDNKHIFFEGKVENGTCKVIIPSGLDIAREGDVLLEVIVDSTVFSPWKSQYQMLVESVKINEVSIKKTDSNAVRIIETSITEQTPKISVSVKEKPKNKFLKENVSMRDKKFVEKSIASYKKMADADKRFLKEHLSKFKPSKKINEWAKNVFIDTTKIIPRVCMYNYGK